MGFEQILEKYRKIAFSERDKGTRFERLMQAYLKTDPRYTSELKEVWLWNEFPYRSDFGGKDIGIDIVVKTYKDEYWAVQCKCFQENNRITKPDVDTFLATSSKIFFDENGTQQKFTHRLWISTTNKWNSEAENTIKNQDPPVSRLSLLELEESPVDWDKLDEGISGSGARAKKKTPMKHQLKAINDTHEYFKTKNRGKLIMACGTGKTYTSLKIAENETGGKGLILFLVPSIALLGQTLNEWYSEAEEKLNAICICSDPTASKKTSKNETDDNLTSVTDLALPASTNVHNIVKQFKWIQATKKEGMTVVFSTYQSIDVIAKAQAELISEFGDKAEFDLIICDEAHRTTGVILAGNKEESAFTKVHDNQIIKSKKRLYMTATPRLYDDNAKQKATDNNCILCSMDDEGLYGEEIYRIGFGEAVQNNLLSDYKVLVLTLTDDQVPDTLQKAISNPEYEINTDDATKLIGCINALSKRMIKYAGQENEAELLSATDPNPMHTAVAFCPNIKASQKIKNIFNTHSESYYESLSEEERNEVVNVEADHVDGGMGASMRDEKLSWLKHAPTDGKECRILTNVRCLSEGVDVPSLDAVMFLSARNSQVDVVQSVGRVMRRAQGKKYGYIIIPVAVPLNVKPEEALDKNDNFKVVWTVLNALRAHDDRFNAMINKIDLNKKNPNDNGTVIVGGVPRHEDDGGAKDSATNKRERVEEKLSDNVVKQLTMQFGELQSVIYARMVQKVGSRKYWEQWAKDIAQIAQRHVDRITRIVADEKYKADFKEFMDGLHTNINPYIMQEEAIEMLAQHIITRPVFEALFENYSFIGNNSVSIAMQKILDILDENAIDKETETLEKFYADVRQRCEGIDNAEGKQKVIIELYDKFFKTALPKVVEKLGIVYTPVEVVDFIINSVADVLKKEFNRDISDKNVHILDPFTGTGTFITRLLQSGRIKKEDLKRKYEEELHANEIVLLAYYIASINIENTYHDLIGAKEGEYQNFEGICLTDTFQLGEEDQQKIPSEFFPRNVKRVRKQKETPITVIVGNPPYSIGQKSENDNAKNQKYEKLDSKISETYVRYSNATLNKGLYDSYIKAFRWASDRLNSNGGIICYVSNGSWLDSNGMDGFRHCLETEFSSVYVYNLRGNARTSGEQRRKEKGNVFGEGSRTPISITLLVKNPNDKKEKVTIYYHDIGDYLSREEKLDIVKNVGSVLSPKFEPTMLKPNEHNDWLNQRSDLFGTYPTIGDKDATNKNKFFSIYSGGVVTSRDAWCYNSSKEQLIINMQNTINFYNSQRIDYLNNREIEVEEFINTDSTKISWSRALKNSLKLNKECRFNPDKIYEGIYRPFVKQNGYIDNSFNEMLYQLPKIFPTNKHENICISISGTGSNKDFSSLIVNSIPCLDMIEKSQSFPLYWYEENEKKNSQQQSLFGNQEEDNDKYIRHDGITDFIHNLAKEKYGHKVTKEDIFYYVYGILHSEDYRTKFAADLKKMLPRIPLVDKVEDFWAFSNAGRDLAKLHLNYEDQAPLATVKVIGEESGIFTVDKMRFKSKEDKSEIIYNPYIRITNIPEVAYDYVVNGKSAIEWVMDRYQVTINKDSQIKNDPNDWAEEHGKPRYILDLLLSVISLSVATVKIVKSLPKLNFEDNVNAN
ncbi:MAG: DEAD/DEAH box helicase [Candidatus Gastranaerophilales bacterium]|nr:DEAD/DEAH box helicase [Candidatus Gastranaerophilales bacterium]